MKTFLIALAASAAFMTAAMAAEMPQTDMNAPAPAAAPMTPAATTATAPDDKANIDAKADMKAEPKDAAASAPAADEKAPAADKDPGVRHAKYRGGEGSTWKTGKNAYGFEGTYGGCVIRGTAGPHGYHIDRDC